MKVCSRLRGTRGWRPANTQCILEFRQHAGGASQLHRLSAVWRTPRRTPGANVWLWTALVLVIAIAGKIGGAVLAARWTGGSWQNAWALGALLNTRGLVELIVLNIAYNAGVFSPALFTILVVMALVTTMMTTALLNLLGIEDRGGGDRDLAVSEIVEI